MSATVGVWYSDSSV